MGSKSEVAAQVEVHLHVGIVVGGWATDRRHGKRSGGTSSGEGVGIVVSAFASDSGLEK